MNITPELIKAQQELMIVCKQLQDSLERNEQENFKIRLKLQASRTELNKMLEVFNDTQENKEADI